MFAGGRSNPVRLSLHKLILYETLMKYLRNIYSLYSQLYDCLVDLNHKG